MDDRVSKQTLLLVDGDPKSLRVLEVSLKKAGFAVVTAPNGVEALATLERSTPELIISDAHMPEMDGFELCRRIKERPPWARIPFIFLSGKKSIEDKIRGLELGVEDYLYKPIYIKEITTRVRILLQRQQRESLESHRETRTRFAGSLADIGVVDLVQTIDVNRKSGIVHVANADGRRGAIYFRDGHVIDGEAGRLSGIDAVYRMFTWSDGSFEVEFKPIRRRDVIELSGQALLMEGMRRLDEWTRMLEALPPLSAVLEVNYLVLAERLGEIPDEVNRILRLFDGRRTLLQVVEDSDFLDLEALSIIGRLNTDQIVYPAEAGKPTASGQDSGPGRLERWLAESPWAHFDETPIPEPMDAVGPTHDSPTLQVAPLASRAAERALAVARLGQTLPGYARASSENPGSEPRRDRIITSPYGMSAVANAGASDGDPTPMPESVTPAPVSPHAQTDTFITPPKPSESAIARAARVQAAQPGEGEEANRSHARASGEIVSAAILRDSVDADDGVEESSDDVKDAEDNRGAVSGEDTGPEDAGAEDFSGDDETDRDAGDEEESAGAPMPAVDSGGTSLLEPGASTASAAERVRLRRTGSARLGTPVPSYAALADDATMSDTLRLSSSRRPWLLWTVGIAIGLVVALVVVSTRSRKVETVVESRATALPPVDLPRTEKPRPLVEPVRSGQGGSGVAATTAKPEPVRTAAATPAAAAAPGDADALDKSCQRAHARGRYPDVVSACGKLLTLRPADARTMVILANAELDHGATDKALAWAKKAVAVDAAEADAYVFIGGAEQELGHNKAARVAYEQYLRLAPTGKYAGDLKVIVQGL